MTHEKECFNCGAQLGTNYCENCGQRSKLPALTFKEIFADFLSSVFNADAPLPITMAGLFKNPGNLIRAYIGGKRRAFYAPVKYVVFCLFINILVGELIGFDPVENQQLLDGRSAAEKANNPGYEIGRFLAKNLNYFTFLFPLSIALFSKIFFWKFGQNFAERTVFGFYVSGQYLILSMIPVLLTTVSPKFIYLVYLLGISYMTFAYFSTYKGKSVLLAFVKSFFASILALVFYFVTAALVASIILNFL